MRRYMKYVAAGLFVAALLVVLFLPLLDISVVEFSLLDVMKLGSGLGDADILSGFGTMLEEYMKPYFFLVLLVMLLLLAGAAVCVFLPWKQAYPVALLGVGIVNVVMVISVGTLYAKTKELREGLSFFGIEDLVGIHGLTVLLWLVLCAGIAGIGVWGTVQALRGPKTEEMRDILPETFARRGNPWEDRQDLTARADHENRQTKGGEDFGGALRGLQGIYRKKVYPMQDRVPIYLAWDGGQSFVSGEQEGEILAEVYYVREYGEYCVTPKERGACFLESGQPLGAGRHYYLRRGTKLCLRGDAPLFELA